MGLDMYLSAKKHITGYKFYKPEERVIYCAVVKALNADDLVDPETPSGTVELTIGYWRKANHIHNWFVTHCADGDDECQEIVIYSEQLLELECTCQKVIADHNKSARLLPCKEGFFFGGTDYDAGYFKDIESTLKIITKAKQAIESGFGIVYQASW